MRRIGELAGRREALGLTPRVGRALAGRMGVAGYDAVMRGKRREHETDHDRDGDQRDDRDRDVAAVLRAAEELGDRAEDASDRAPEALPRALADGALVCGPARDRRDGVVNGRHRPQLRGDSLRQHHVG